MIPPIYPDNDMRTTVYWPTSDRTTAIQVHDKTSRQTVLKLDGVRRIAYAVQGGQLEVFEIPYALPWCRTRFNPLGFKEVYGGSASEEFGSQGDSAFGPEK